jgi:hypothetical protein
MTIQIDQDGLSPGTPGVSRTDGLATGALVTLTNTGSGATTFRLLWTPPGDTTAVSSLEQTEDPKAWTFSPSPNEYGSYRIELVETGEIRVLVMRTPNLGLVIPAFGERGDPGANLMIADAAQINAAENNATDYGNLALNYRQYAGWWRALHEVITSVDSVTSGVDGATGDTGPTGATGATGPAGSSSARKFTRYYQGTSGTHVFNANTRMYTLRIQGGGGGGGFARGVAGSCVVGRGGRAGKFYEKTIITASQPVNATYYVGIGGTGGKASLNTLPIQGGSSNISGTPGLGYPGALVLGGAPGLNDALTGSTLMFDQDGPQHGFIVSASRGHGGNGEDSFYGKANPGGSRITAGVENGIWDYHDDNGNSQAPFGAGGAGGCVANVDGGLASGSDGYSGILEIWEW